MWCIYNIFLKCSKMFSFFYFVQYYGFIKSVNWLYTMSLLNLKAPQFFHIIEIGKNVHVFGIWLFFRNFEFTGNWWIYTTLGTRNNFELSISIFFSLFPFFSATLSVPKGPKTGDPAQRNPTWLRTKSDSDFFSIQYWDWASVTTDFERHLIAGKLPFSL